MTTNNLAEAPAPTKVNNRHKVFCSYSKMVPISEIVEHPKNANNHGREQVEILAHAINATGWRTPIGVSKRSGYIIRGHGRFAAAKALGLVEVPVDFQDYETEAQEVADLLADNKIADLSEIDYEGVSNLLKSLPQDQMLFTGFRDFEIAPLLLAEWQKPALVEMPEQILSVRFSTTDAQGETVRKAIKVCQSRETADLTDGECLEKIATWYLSGVIAQEAKVAVASTSLASDVPVRKEKKAPKAAAETIPFTTNNEPTVKSVVFLVKRVAGTTINDQGVDVIVSEDGARYYTVDQEIVAAARASLLASPQYKVVGLIDISGENFWVTKLEKENATA